jgi:hypothetical protein
MPFFTFTAQGLGQLAAVTIIGIKVLRVLRKFDRNVSSWLWEHEVMWRHHRTHHDIPTFPDFTVQKRTGR